MSRLATSWSRLSREQRLAAVASVALLGTMFLPWYQKNFANRRGALTSDQLTAFGVFSFVEAAILLVALGVLALLWARAERRGFLLPGGDGTIIAVAGGWAALLLFWRAFDRPDVDDPAATIGITWGLFVAFLAAGALTVAGLRLRERRAAPPGPEVRPARGHRPSRRPSRPEPAERGTGPPPPMPGQEQLPFEDQSSKRA